MCLRAYKTTFCLPLLCLTPRQRVSPGTISVKFYDTCCSIICTVTYLNRLTSDVIDVYFLVVCSFVRLQKSLLVGLTGMICVFSSLLCIIFYIVCRVSAYNGKHFVLKMFQHRWGGVLLPYHHIIITSHGENGCRPSGL